MSAGATDAAAMAMRRRTSILMACDALSVLLLLRKLRRPGRPAAARPSWLAWLPPGFPLHTYGEVELARATGAASVDAYVELLVETLQKAYFVPSCRGTRISFEAARWTSNRLRYRVRSPGEIDVVHEAGGRVVARYHLSYRRLAVASAIIVGVTALFFIFHQPALNPVVVMAMVAPMALLLVAFEGSATHAALLRQLRKAARWTPENR